MITLRMLVATTRDRFGVHVSAYGQSLLAIACSRVRSDDS